MVAVLHGAFCPWGNLLWYKLMLGLLTVELLDQKKLGTFLEISHIMKKSHRKFLSHDP
jgi:hypothetical protein